VLRCAQALPALSRSDRENEAVAVLKEFTEAAYGALVGINFVELERHLITLVYAANRLSYRLQRRPPIRWCAALWR